MDLAQALGELHLPSAIVPAADHDRLVEAARGLPVIWECACVESRLSPGTPVDLLAAAADSVGRVEGAWPCPVPPELQAWIEDPDMGPVPQVWLEWDDARAQHPPLFWWGVDPALYDRARPAPTADWPAELGRRLGATEGVQAVLRDIGRLVLPEGRARGICHLSVREKPVWRIFVELGRERLRPFLEALSWPGDIDRIAREWVKAVPLNEPGFLQLEFDEGGLGPYLALEARETNRWFGNAGPRRRWMEHLATMGLIRPDQADALLAWPDPKDDRWERRFHLKLVMAPGPPQLKAYLGFRPVLA